VGLPTEPDGVYLGIPFKVRDEGEVEAMMVGGLVIFRDFDQLIASAKGESILDPGLEPKGRRLTRV
jgi:hypothetical protein